MGVDNKTEVTMSTRFEKLARLLSLFSAELILDEIVEVLSDSEFEQLFDCIVESNGIQDI